MSILTSLIYDELIVGNNLATTKQQFFEESFKRLREGGFVEETFLNAILKREAEYPTGLELKNLSISIPHTDVEHVNKPFVFINRMVNKRIKFIQMGTDNEIVRPEYIIILGIKNPKEQVELLSELLELFNQEAFTSKLALASSNNEIKEAFINPL